MTVLLLCASANAFSVGSPRYLVTGNMVTVLLSWNVLLQPYCLSILMRIEFCLTILVEYVEIINHCDQLTVLLNSRLEHLNINLV